MLYRVRPRPPPVFIQPCLPTRADKAPSSVNWIHEIKHDGFRMMVGRDAAGVRLLTRNGIDWTTRFPLIAEAAAALRVKYFLIDGEAVCCDGNGMPVFERLRYRRDDRHVFLYAFDLLQLDRRDLRRDPIEDRKAELAKLLRRAKPGLQLNEHISEPGDIVFRTPASSAWKASCRSVSARPTGPGARMIGSSSRIQKRRL
jgi:bifunctional non-homologous end joining protein LigD